MDDSNIKTGYLEENFRLFHITDKCNKEFKFHYHDFNKIVIFLSGKVTYVIEGKAYYLKPWDILLVNHCDVHKPVVDESVTYERIIIWVKTEYIDSYINENCDITRCFFEADSKSFNLIRLDPELLEKVQKMIKELELSVNSTEFGSKILSESIFIQLMVYLNRIFMGEKYLKDYTSLKYDKQIAEVLKYINSNLSKDLSNEKIAEQFFLSKYYLMHKFKQETGYTLHNYITQKRIAKASELIRGGIPVMKASQMSGFNDYSSFLRAYRKRYNRPPGSNKNI